MIDKASNSLDKLYFLWRNAILLQCNQKIEAMKKLFAIIILTTLGINAFAYDFYAVCPSGQTLYYNVISLNERTVALTYYEYYWDSYEYYETYYYGAPAPSGDVIIPETVESHGILFTVVEVGAHAFHYCDLTSVIFPNTIIKIGQGAFYADMDLNEPGLIGELVLPENLQTIEKEAFCWNTRLTDVAIPNSVTTIGQSCFNTCTNLSHLTIGSGVEEIGYAAFNRCTHLSSITVDRITPPTCQWWTFNGVPKDIPVYIPRGTKPLYEQTEYWDEFTNFIEEETLNTNENDLSGIAVYPIPANGVLYVETRRATSIHEPTYRITNVNGQILLTGTLSVQFPQCENTTTIDVSSLHAGMYFISVGKQTLKFIVK